MLISHLGRRGIVQDGSDNKCAYQFNTNHATDVHFYFCIYKMQVPHDAAHMVSYKFTVHSCYFYF